jgi:hypothetical protein
MKVVVLVPVGSQRVAEVRTVNIRFGSRGVSLASACADFENEFRDCVTEDRKGRQERRKIFMITFSE